MKANSERVKGKNFRELAGSPLFKWILNSLLAVPEIDKVIINTDAKHILMEHGLIETDRVVIRERKPELCGDMVSMNKIIADDISNFKADMYLMTHTTNPLISSKTIKEGLNLLLKHPKNDSLFTVNKIQTRFYRENTSPINHDPDNLIRTQDLEPWFEENSCLYYFTKKSFGETQARIGKTPLMMITPPLESLDIDEPHDWELVAALANTRKQGNEIQ